jgi:hypothetical protein
MLRQSLIVIGLVWGVSGCSGAIILGSPDGGGADASASTCLGEAPACYGDDDRQCCSHDPVGVAVCAEGAWMCGNAYAPGCSGAQCACDDGGVSRPDSGGGVDGGTGPLPDSGGGVDGGVGPLPDGGWGYDGGYYGDGVSYGYDAGYYGDGGGYGYDAGYYGDGGGYGYDAGYYGDGGGYGYDAGWGYGYDGGYGYPDGGIGYGEDAGVGEPPDAGY